MSESKVRELVRIERSGGRGPRFERTWRLAQQAHLEISWPLETPFFAAEWSISLGGNRFKVRAVASFHRKIKDAVVTVELQAPKAVGFEALRQSAWYRRVDESLGQSYGRWEELDDADSVTSWRVLQRWNTASPEWLLEEMDRIAKIFGDRSRCRPGFARGRDDREWRTIEKIVVDGGPWSPETISFGTNWGGRWKWHIQTSLSFHFSDSAMSSVDLTLQAFLRRRQRGSSKWLAGISKEAR
ncbi:MAG: hypothetical protein QM765_39840 [Myxococcales bacterium]